MLLRVRRYACLGVGVGKPKHDTDEQPPVAGSFIVAGEDVGSSSGQLRSLGTRPAVLGLVADRPKAVSAP